MSSRDWPFVGRAGDLARATAAVCGSGGVMLVGPAGVGKTRLARQVLSEAGRRAGVTRWVGATAAARGVPLGAFAALVADCAGPADASLLGRAAAAVCSDVAVLAVDDAHLLDDVSATLLHQLAAKRATRLVVTVRSGEPTSDAVTALWKDGLVERLDLAPLGERDTSALVEAALGGPIDGPSRGRLFAATQGNVLWLRHLVEGEWRAGRLAQAAGVWRWTGEPRMTPALTDLIDMRIGPLPEPLRHLLELVALGEPLGVDLLAKLVDRAAVEQAVQRGLVVVEPAGRRLEVRLAHPLYGEAARSRADPLLARRRRGELAEALSATGARRVGDTLRQAVLALDSDLPADPALLTEAGTVATSLGDVPLAERLFRAARDAGGGFEPQLGLGSTLSLCMRVGEAETEFARSVTAAATDIQQVRATLMRVNNLYFMLARPMEALSVLDEAENSLPPGPARADLAGIRPVLAQAGNRISEALRAGAVVLDSPGASRHSVAWAGCGVLPARAQHGMVDQLGELAERAVAAAIGSPDTVVLQLPIGYWQVYGLGLAGELGQARESTLRLRALPGTYAALFRDLGDGRIALECGQVRTAARLIGAFRSSFPGHGCGWGRWLDAGVAQALGMAGDAVGARQALDRADVSGQPGVVCFEPEVMLARAWLAAAEGAVSRAVELAGDAAGLARSSEQWAVEVVARHAAVCFGDPGQVAPLAALAERVDGPRAPAAAAHAAALADQDADGLLAASAQLEQLELLLLAADAAAQAAVLHRAQGRATQAAFAAARAAGLAQRCEDARTPALVAGTSPLLISAREREVATLAATGLTNRQIAARLHVSVRTVEGHVYRACTRLDLPDRAALAAVVADDAAALRKR